MTSASTQVALSRAAIIAALVLSCTSTQYAFAGPTITQLAGSLDHKATVTVSGAGFGTKETAAPLVWDDASGTNLLSKWSGAWPDNNSAYNTTYRAPHRGINLPHANITRYIAGAHAENLGANAGYNVVVFKTFTRPAFPYSAYASWYQRVDDAWVFGGDNNLKTFAYSKDGSPYEMPNNWYSAYGPPYPGSRTDTAEWLINDDGSSLMNPDVNGHSFWWNNGVNPMAGQWAKVEVAVRLTDQTDGYIRIWENGALRVDYKGPTDRYAGTTRTIGIGGYARMSGQPSNWRYFADLYLDLSLSRVVLANNADLTKATVIETQIPNNWNDSSVSFSVNLGKFQPGQTAYLFVFNGSGDRNATGYPVTIGGGEIPPKSPTSLIAQ